MRRAALIGWIVVGVVAAEGSVAVFHAHDDETRRLIDLLCVRGLLPLDAMTVRQHDRVWLRDRLRERLNAPERLSPATQTRMADLLRVLNEEEETYRFDVAEPGASASLNFGTVGVFQRDSEIGANGVQIGTWGRVVADAGFVGAQTEAAWGLVTRRYREAPDEFRNDIPSFKILPEQIVAAKGHLSIGTPTIHAQFGKMDVAWSPGVSGNLVLSDQSAPKSGFRFAGLWGPVRFESLTAHLNRPQTESYVSAHRVSVRVHPRVVLTGYESVVAGSLVLNYWNPFVSYLLESMMTIRDSNLNDSVLFGGEALVRVGEGVVLFGEILLDDYQPQEGSAGFKNWDSKFGTQIGVRAVEPFGLRDVEWRAEYTFVNQYAYTHEFHGTVYALKDDPLGFWMGPDSDSLWMDVSKTLDSRNRLGFTLRRDRKGEQDLFDPHQNDDPNEWTFLSGVEEIRSRADVYFMHHRAGRRSFAGRAHVVRRENIGHRDGESRTDAGIEFTLRRRF